MEKQKILAVDDDPFIRALLAEIMAKLGHECDVAEDGLAALDKLAAGSYTIVITDIKMPRLDGVELTKRIKEKYNNTDIIVITAYNADYKYTDVIRAGASDFISKPFNVDELEAKLSRIIRERTLRHELETLSIRDELTNIYNRRHFNVKLEEESYRAYRQGYNLFLILMDIDDFKNFNDQKGHQEGDILLHKLGKVILSSVRENVDWGFRYGGDEFAVIVTQATEDQAEKIAERIKTKYNAEHLEPTSLSIGLAKLIYSPSLTPQENMDILIRAADKALYSAKSAGGNQITLAEV
jgi:two-component system cell cycle response regulator